MAWDKIKKLFGFEGFSSAEANASIQKLVSANALNKRKNARIRYPHFGASGPFPHVFYLGTELIVHNVSVGGLLVIDDTEKFGSEVGETVNIEMVWPDFTTKVRAQIVGANQQRRHMQFVDFNAQVFLRISQLIKPGYTGSRFHQITNDSGQLTVEEMWMGPTQETLVFMTDSFPAELTYQNDKILIKRGSPTLFAKTQQPIPPALLQDLLVLFANIPHPTARIKELCDIMDTELRALKPRRTGSYG